MNIKRREGYLVMLLLMAMAVLSITFFQPAPVSANPSYFTPFQPSGGATSTYNFIQAGLATSTYNINPGTTTGQGTDSGSLIMHLLGSTSVNTLYATTTFNVAVEYSQNCQDYYADTYTRGATTTQTVNFAQPSTFQITLATTTIQGNQIATSTATTRILNIPMPTRCARVITSIPIGSTNGGVWMQYIGKHENN